MWHLEEDMGTNKFGVTSMYVVVAVLLVSILVTAATAQPMYGHRYRSMISGSQANSIALSRFPRGVLVGGARLVTINGRNAYRVGGRSGGMRHNVFVNAYNGRILMIRDRMVGRSMYNFRR
jgi:hypothetical protein